MNSGQTSVRSSSHVPTTRLPWVGFKQLVLPLLISLSASSTSFAHDPGLSTATVRLCPGRVEAVVTFASKDAEQLLNATGSPAITIPTMQSVPGQDLLKAVVAKEFEIKLDGLKASLTDSSCHQDENGNVSIQLAFTRRRFDGMAVQSELINRLPFGHRQYLVVQSADRKTIADAMLSANARCFSTRLDTPATSLPGRETGSLLSFLALGVEHILTGYDHLLFLLALLIVTNRLLPTLRIITSFTVAHSITLALATLNFLPAPSRIIEPLIAASVVYVGLENLVSAGAPKGRWVLTFAFGLIHGCGFATALRDLGVGAGGAGVVGPLVAFNLGVEFGQVAVACVALPVIWKLRTHPAFVRRWIPATSILVAVLGACWLVERTCF